MQTGNAETQVFKVRGSHLEDLKMINYKCKTQITQDHPDKDKKWAQKILLEMANFGNQLVRSSSSDSIFTNAINVALYVKY